MKHTQPQLFALTFPAHARVCLPTQLDSHGRLASAHEWTRLPNGAWRILFDERDLSNPMWRANLALALELVNGTGVAEYMTRQNGNGKSTITRFHRVA